MLAQATPAAADTLSSSSITTVAAKVSTGSGTSDPYSPGYGHQYRAGAFPTKTAFAQMQKWVNGHHTSSTSAQSSTPASNEFYRPAYAGELGTGAGGPLYWQGGQTVDGVAGSGVVSGAPKVYLVFWGNQWGDASSNAGIQSFSNDVNKVAEDMQNLFKGLGTNGEQWSNLAAEYCDGPASVLPLHSTACPASAHHVGVPVNGALAGVWYDNAAASPSSATQQQLGSEAIAAATHFGNTTAASNRYAQYIILSPHGTHPDGFNAGASFCAWHSDAYDAHNNPVPFTNMPYTPDFPNGGCGGGSGSTRVVSHEYMETLTDEYPDSGWFTYSSGNTSISENGDLCYLQPGVSLALSTGTFTVQQMYSNAAGGCLASAAAPKPGNTVTVTNPGNQTGTVGTAVNLPIAAKDSAGAALTYTASGLPAGLSINASTAVISGTPTTAATSTVTVTAKDATGATGSTTFTFTVNAKATTNTVAVTNPGNQTGTVGTAVNLPIVAKDSAGAALAYTASGLPAGLSINASTGVISGTPTTAATSTVTVTAKDATGATGSTTFTFTVNAKSTANTVTVTNPGNQTGTVGTAVNVPITAKDSAGAALTYTASGLPAGLVINASTGVISGTPTTAAASTATVTAKDATGASGSATFTFSVNPKPTGTCTARQLVIDGGFEAGGTAWTQLYDNQWAFPDVMTQPYFAHTGNAEAVLDGFSSPANDSVSQQLTIPAGCHATLTYWVWELNSKNGSTVTDTLTATVNGTQVQQITNLNGGTGYVQHTVDLSAYAGQTVKLAFTGATTTTSSNTVAFLLDDIALNVN